jgi:hypothetical protein
MERKEVSVKGDYMKKLLETIDAARPEHPRGNYAIGYDDGLIKAKQIIEKNGYVSIELHKAVMAERDLAIAQLEDNGIQFGSNAADAVRVVRCVKCKWFDPDSDYCQFWHSVRHPGHYCGEGERKDD